MTCPPSSGHLHFHFFHLLPRFGAIFSVRMWGNPRFAVGAAVLNPSEGVKSLCSPAVKSSWLQALISVFFFRLLYWNHERSLLKLWSWLHQQTSFSKAGEPFFWGSLTKRVQSGPPLCEGHRGVSRDLCRRLPVRCSFYLFLSAANDTLQCQPSFCWMVNIPAFCAERNKYSQTSQRLWSAEPFRS